MTPPPLPRLPSGPYAKKQDGRFSSLASQSSTICSRQQFESASVLCILQGPHLQNSSTLCIGLDQSQSQEELQMGRNSLSPALLQQATRSRETP